MLGCGCETRGILLVLVMPRCWDCSWRDAVGAGRRQSWGQREHHCGPTTPPGVWPGAQGRAVPGSRCEGLGVG